MAIETRRHQTTTPVELRMEPTENENEVRVSGYAAVFDTIGDGGFFRERIERGAFKDAIPASDVRLVVNHDGIPLARTPRVGKPGTLTLREDDTGLHYEATLDRGSPIVQGLESALKRGDMDQSSFAFTVDEEREDMVDGEPVRTVVRVREIFDVSPVTYPFYDSTTVSARHRCPNCAPESVQEEEADPTPIEMFEARQRHAEAVG